MEHGLAKGLVVGSLALLAGAGVQAARSVSVESVSNNVVTLTFGESDSQTYKLAVARGARDAGDTRADWDALEIIGDVAPDQTSATWAVPSGEYRYARFFLFDTNLPFKNCLAMVRSNQTRGALYVDTQVAAKTPVKAELDMTMATKNNDTEFLGAYSGGNRFYLAHMNDSKLGQVFGSFTYPTVSFSSYVGWRYTSVVTEAKLGTSAIYVSSTTPFATKTLSGSSEVGPGNSLYLFNCNGVSNLSSDLKLVRCRIWKGENNLVRDFIPIEDNNGNGALFDLVSRQVFSAKNQGTGAIMSLAKGVVVETPAEVYQTANSSATVEIRPMGALLAKRDFLNDPTATVDSLALPTGADSPRTVVVRFKALAAGADTVRPILQLKAGDTVVRSYSLDASNALGAQTVSADAWHTLTVVGGPTRLDCYLDETRLVASSNEDGITTLSGVTDIVFGDGDSTTEENVQFAYAEVWSVAGAGEGLLAAGTKSGLVGEWTFPLDNPVRATKGHDLEKFKMQSDNNFACSQNATDGVVEGDAKVYVGNYNGFRCRHGLAVNSDYSVVMDVRVPSTSGNVIHGVFQANTFGATDCNLFLRKNADKDLLDAWVTGGTYIATEVRHGEWCRAVITYANNGNKTLFLNGKQIDARAFANSKIIGPYCFFCVDNNGEDNDIDISYAAIYDRVLTAAEVAEFHGRPTAHASPSGEVLIVPECVGVWERQNGSFVSRVDGAPTLTAQSDGSYTLTQATAPAGMTVVVDLKPPYVQAQSGVLMANTNGVATGVYGTTGDLSGCLATTTDPTIFAAGTGDTGTAAWGGSTYEPLRRGMEQRVVVTWDALGHVRYYVNGQLITLQDPTAADVSAQPTETMTFLTGLGRSVSRLSVYNGALTPAEVASLGGFEMVPPVPGTLILVR